eukprot:299288-Rhodomonas_salina.1
MRERAVSRGSLGSLGFKLAVGAAVVALKSEKPSARPARRVTFRALEEAEGRPEGVPVSGP